MAISDVLSESVEAIEGYLHNQPSMYAELRPQIDALLKEMVRVRILLDRPPYDDPAGPSGSLWEATNAAIWPRS